MIQLLHYLHLSLHTLASVRLHQLELFIDLDSYLLIEHLVQPEAHDCVGTLTDALANEIVVQVLYCTVLRAKLYHVLARLALALVHLSLIKWMLIEQFSGGLDLILILVFTVTYNEHRAARSMLTHGSRGLISHWPVHLSGLDGRWLDHNSLIFIFVNIINLFVCTDHARDVWHVLRAIHVI